jgi:hypothetical protein
MDTVPLVALSHGIPAGGLDMTGAFMPLSLSMVLVLGFVAVALITSGIDSWWTERQAKKAALEPTPFRNAA